MSSRDTHPLLRPRRGPAILLALLALATLCTLGLLYRQRVASARIERTQALAAALSQMREAIRTSAKRPGPGPASLSDLVASRDLAAIPTDPITGSTTTWRVITEETVVDDAFRGEGRTPRPVITDVRSGAPGRDDAGKLWSEY